VKEVGMYRGGSGWLSVKFKDIAGTTVIPSPSDVVLKVYRPDNTLYTSYSGTNIVVETDGEVRVLVNIPEDEVVGVWVAEWIYNDPDSGKPFKVEMPFVVSDVAY
jgi:hypothetical protein